MFYRISYSGLKFINVLHEAFMFEDPKSIKKTVKLSIFFALSGSARVIATHRTLMKLTPGFDTGMTVLRTNLRIR